jgi:hypothetical protein
MAEHGAEESGDVWEILSSKYVVKDRWLTLRADDCLNADGQVIAPYYVLEYPPWVNVMALSPEHNVVLIKQYRHGIRQIILELPGGVTVHGSRVTSVRKRIEPQISFSGASSIRPKRAVSRALARTFVDRPGLIGHCIRCLHRAAQTPRSDRVTATNALIPGGPRQGLAGVRRGKPLPPPSRVRLQHRAPSAHRTNGSSAKTGS